MNVKQKAVEELKKLSRSFQGIISLADDLEKVSSLEQAIKESENRLESILSKESEVSELHNLALAEIEDMKAKANAIVLDAQKEAEKMYEVASLKNASLLTGSADKVKAIESALSDKVATVDANILKATKVLLALEADANEKAALVESLNKELSVIKAKLGA